MPAKGIKDVRRRLTIAANKINGPTTDAAVYAVLSQGAAISDAMTPQDTGMLLNSRYAPQITQQARKTVGTVGYTARYAEAVHDAPGKLKGQPRSDFGMTSNRSRVGPQVPTAFGGGTGQGNYWDPGGEPGFLRKGFEEIKPAVPAILKAIYRV